MFQRIYNLCILLRERMTSMIDTYRKFNIYLGHRVMETRLNQHLTREYVAEAADISSKFLYEIEKGKKGCSTYVLYRISDALNVSPSYLMLDTQNKAVLEINPVYTNLNNEYKELICDIIQLFYEKC